MESGATYLQAFYFSLKTEDEVFHVPTIQTLSALLFWGRRSFRIGLLLRQLFQGIWLPLLRQLYLSLVTTLLVRIEFASCEKHK